MAVCRARTPLDRVAWMFGMSIDADITATTRFIPEVVWHGDIRATPLERPYDTVLERFNRSVGRPVVIPKLRNKAHPQVSAKGLLYLATQRKRTSHQQNVQKQIMSDIPLSGQTFLPLT